MQITLLGGASEVGASCQVLQVGGRHLLIDGGMRPAARPGQSRIPDLSLLEAAPPEALLITHAHIDHTGALPLIASLYPGIPIYASESTKVLTELLLRDSVRIMEQEGLKPEGETPLYSAEQVDTLLGRMKPVAFHQPFAPLPSSPDITVRYLPAGHILGAAMLFFQTPEGTLFHTGDISVTDQRTIKGLDLQGLPQADIMISEGTYGARAHVNRKEEERKLAETVQATLARGGRVLAPAFAVGRAQEVILILKTFRASGQVSPVPIHLDGMVRSVCTAYQNQSHDLHPSLQRYQLNARRPLFADPDLHIFAVRSPDRPGLLKKQQPMVVISSSGMLSGGASPLYAAELAADERNCILFSGYQDEESPGAALLRAKQGDTIRLGTGSLTLNCQVARYNLSGHADGDQIVHVVSKVAPKQLILVHGAPDALETLAQRFSRIQVHVPQVGDTLTLAASSTKRAGGQQPDSIVSETVGEIDPVEQAPVLAPPTIEDLWQVAVTHGATRPWTSVELGQHFYGNAYRPAMRADIERILKDAVPFFKIGRVGSQPTYLPRSAQERVSLAPLREVKAGDIVIVQGQKGTPQLAVLLSSLNGGTITLVADQWKAGVRPFNLIQLLPGIRRPDLVELPAEQAQTELKQWRKHLSEEWVDVIALWERCKGQAFSFEELCGTLASTNELLAYGLELLVRGDTLFRREGMMWYPLERERVLENAGFVHHLELLHAGKGAQVMVNDQPAVLTGRSTWHCFEVQWTTREDAGKASRVRRQHISISGHLPGEGRKQKHIGMERGEAST